jgi:predicted DNA-binding transcriptional regulator YafY
MNRVDRLFAILLLLQRKRHVRAQDLAHSFEVSERTIYRDMEALCESRVPILGTPGQGYELMQGYFLPPLLFTASEANALFLGAKMLLAHTKGQVAAEAERALAKIAVILPGNVRVEVERLTEVLGFAAPANRFDLYEQLLATLQLAIRVRRVVRMKYHSLSKDELTERDIEPVGMYYLGGIWYVDAYCRLRDDFRNFRLNRMESIQLLAERFELRPPSVATRPEMTLVRIRFAAPMASWIRERQHYGFVCEETTPSGDAAIMTYQVDNVSEIVPWLLGWGAAATPLQPPELREAIRREALALAEELS